MDTTLRRTARAVAAAATVAFALLAPASVDAGNSLPEPTLSATPSTVEAGAPITVTGTGWICGSQPYEVGLRFDGGAFVAMVTPTFQGTFTTTITAPSTLGTVSLDAVEIDLTETCIAQVSFPLNVVQPATTTTTTTTVTSTTASPTTAAPVARPGGGSLPDTGARDEKMALVAGLTLLLGVGATLVARRPRTA